MAEYEHHEQPFAPVFDENSKVLILGTFPSVKSRANNFIMVIRRTDFGKVLAALCGELVPQTVEEKSP